MEVVTTSKPLVLLSSNYVDGKKCVSRSCEEVFMSSLDARDRKLICVTSGNTNLGSQIVKKLLSSGYLVRVTIENQEDLEDIKNLMSDVELNLLESVIVAKIRNVESLCDAFRGCHAIFHTSSFIDPHGITGYSEQMAFIEAEAASNVIKACASVAYVKRCIFTSSLLASIWGHDSHTTQPKLINDTCWSDEEFCRENKLWLALGKTRAEKVAWRKASEMKVNLVVLCPGLLLSSSFPNDHIASSLPYLKGGRMMLKRGVLAVADVKRVAEAHVCVYEAMDHGAIGRYYCFDNVIQKRIDAIQLENGLRVQGNLISGTHDQEDLSYENIQTNISNSRLAALVLQASKRSTKRRECEFG
ncbi:hypothetical protein ACFE04_006776 [Oxalis oulophora]